MRIYKNIQLSEDNRLKAIRAYYRGFTTKISEAKDFVDNLLASGQIEFSDFGSDYFLEVFIREHFKFDLEYGLEVVAEQSNTTYDVYIREPDAETQKALDWYESCTSEQREHIDKLTIWFQTYPVA